MDFVMNSLQSIKPKDQEKKKDNSQKLETAYLMIKDCREGEAQTVTPKKTKSVLETLTSAVKDKISPPKKEQDSKTIKVQFNPTTLKFQTENEQKNNEKASIDKKENGDVETIQETKNGTKLSVSMTLVFDSTTNEKESVQTFVERFIALVKNPYIRQIDFCWGKLYYQGVIGKVSAQYVLFNKSGTPTRANVELKLNLL